jgi:holin-like protein
VLLITVITQELLTLKLFKQFIIIIALSFIGEVLHALIPFPIPASIYGILLLFMLLERKVLQLDDVNEVSSFLIFIMPLLFVPAAVGLIESWDELRASLTAYVTIIVAVTLLVMVATGLITQWFLRLSRKSVNIEKEHQT